MAFSAAGPRLCLISHVFHCAFAGSVKLHFIMVQRDMTILSGKVAAGCSSHVHVCPPEHADNYVDDELCVVKPRSFNFLLLRLLLLVEYKITRGLFCLN